MRGERIKELRESRGLSQLELAELLNTNQSQISRWEKSKNIPQTQSLEMIAEFFDVTADYILGLVDHPDDQITMSDLDPLERNLIELVRMRSLKDAMALLLKMDDKG